MELCKVKKWKGKKNCSTTVYTDILGIILVFALARFSWESLERLRDKIFITLELIIDLFIYFWKFIIIFMQGKHKIVYDVVLSLIEVHVDAKQ